VVDVGSTDGTVEILQRYGSVMGSRLTWTSEPDEGLADAWNKAVHRARGDWLIFLGADDGLSAPDVLSRVALRLVGAFPEYSIVYGIVSKTGLSGHVVEYLDQPWSPAKFRGCVANLPHSAVFHHRSLFERHGSFDGSFMLALDYDFLLRALMDKVPLRLEGLVITNAQIGGVSTNYRHQLRAVREHIRLCRRHIGWTPPAMYWWVAKTWGIWLLYQLGGDRLVFASTNFYCSLVNGHAPLRH
jgi:glycosyltransferase involved in cell wall biosynthesis